VKITKALLNFWKYISFKISKKRNFEEFKGDDYNIISFILK